MHAPLGSKTDPQVIPSAQASGEKPQLVETKKKEVGSPSLSEHFHSFAHVAPSGK
jgi:hypothetical protein